MRLRLAVETAREARGAQTTRPVGGANWKGAARASQGVYRIKLSRRCCRARLLVVKFLSARHDESESSKVGEKRRVVEDCESVSLRV